MNSRFSVCVPLILLLVSMGLCLPGLASSPAAQKAARQKDPKPAAEPASPAQTEAQTRALQEALEKAIPDLMDKGDIPGLSIALIRDGRVAWSHGFGVKNLGTREPVTPSTVFEAASLGKPVFAYAVLKLVEAGKLDIDAPLVKYLPGYVQNDDRINQITARRVLTHTTGFPNWRPFGKPLEIFFTPGEKFSYSGEGFVYLQKVVEHITGERLNDVMRRLVFDPLGMKSSSYTWTKEYDATCATGYMTGRVAVTKGKPDKENAASSLHTTAADYAAFTIAILNGTGLKKDTLDRMLTPQVKLNPGCINCTAADSPNTRVSSPSLAWGLGIGLERGKAGEAFWHWGDNGSFRCFVMGYPREKNAVVVFTNTEDGLSIMPELVAEVFGPDHPVFAWLRYDSYDAQPKVLFRAILKDGIESALKQYNESDRGALDESQTNEVGYWLLKAKKMPESIAVFRLNTEQHPDSANAYDSLGEALMTSGANDQAIEAYKKSLELNPKNENAIFRLKKLEGN